jgi:DNA polymerase-3 subunit delta
MTALKGKAIEAFLVRRDPAVSAALVFGPDLGLVRERADRLARQVCDDFRDAFNYIELTDADLKSTPSRLADEAAAYSMMGGERVVRVRASSDSAVAAASLLLKGLETGLLKSNALVIVEAGDLLKHAALRKMFESSKSAAAVPCYADSPGDLRALAVEMAQAAGYSFETDAIELTVSLLGHDRGVSRSEIEKLLLYKGPKSGDGPPSITVDEVRASLCDAGADAAGEAAAATADGDAARLACTLHRLREAGASPVALVRALQRDFSRLRAAQALIGGGAGVPDAIAQLRPPVFFGERRAFESRLAHWPLAKIEAALDLLVEAEFVAKTTGAPDMAVVERAAFRVAALLRH